MTDPTILEKLTIPQLVNVFMKLHIKAGDKSQNEIKSSLELTFSVQDYSKSKNPDSDLSKNRRILIIEEYANKLKVELTRNDRGEIEMRDKADTILNFIYHYIGNKRKEQYEIRKANLKINLSQNKVELKFSKGRSNKEAGFRFELLGHLEEEKEEHEQVCLIFNESRFYFNSETKDYLPSITHLKCPKDYLSKEKYIIGTYASRGPDCGVVILKRCEEENIHDEIQKKDLDPYISQILVGKKFSFDKESPVNIFEYNKKLVDDVKSYNGVYRGYCLGSSSNKEAIHELKFQFYNGCQVKFLSSRTGTHDGYVIDYDENNLRCVFDYNIRTSQFKLSIILNVNEGFGDLPSKSLIGVLSGIDKNNNPMGGRILLIPTTEAFEDINIQTYRFINKKHGKISELFKKLGFLKGFLLGEYDNYVDNLSILKKLQSQEGDEIRFSKNKNFIKYSGLYYYFRIDTDGEKIYKFPMILYPNGKADWFITNHGNYYEKLSGIFNTMESNKVISIFYYSKSEVSTEGQVIEKFDCFEHHLIYFADRKKTIVKLLEGVSTALTSTGKLKCSRGVFQFIKEPDFNNINPFELIKLIETKGFDEMDNKSPTEIIDQLLVFLASTPNNLIVSHKEKNPKYNAIPSNNSGHTFFVTALYSAKQNKSKQFIIELLELAIENGFKHKTHIKYHIKHGILKGHLSIQEFDQFFNDTMKEG